MSAVIIASLHPSEGRTAVAAGLGARLAREGHTVRLMRVRSDAGADPAAEDDAQALATVPGCDAPSAAVTEQDARAQVRDAGLSLIETPPGVPAALAPAVEAKVVLVTSRVDDERLAALAAARDTLGEACLGVIANRQSGRALATAPEALEARGLRCLGVVPEDALLAGPTVREIEEALHATRLAGDGDQDDAMTTIMLGPITADPGQPYFLQHAHKAVVNRFDKMDLHLAALATQPACLILTGGRDPSPYLLDRAGASDVETIVLLAPQGTVQTMDVLDELFTRTRFTGRTKIERAAELIGERVGTEPFGPAPARADVPTDEPPAKTPARKPPPKGRKKRR